MKSIQLQSNDYDNSDLLRAAGVKRIYPGWYTVHYRGAKLDKSTVCEAKRNRGGRLITAPPIFHP